MTTLDQMAKAAYEKLADLYEPRGLTWVAWDEQPEWHHEDWRAAIRAALAAANDPLAPDELEAEVKPDAVTG